MPITLALFNWFRDANQPYKTSEKAITFRPKIITPIHKQNLQSHLHLNLSLYNGHLVTFNERIKISHRPINATRIIRV